MSGKAFEAARIWKLSSEKSLRACRGQRRIDHNGHGGGPMPPPLVWRFRSPYLVWRIYIYIYKFHSYIYIYVYIYTHIHIYTVIRMSLLL